VSLGGRKRVMAYFFYRDPVKSSPNEMNEIDVRRFSTRRRGIYTEKKEKHKKSPLVIL
jgi:hypothetical protein